MQSCYCWKQLNALKHSCKKLLSFTFFKPICFTHAQSVKWNWVRMICHQQSPTMVLHYFSRGFQRTAFTSVKCKDGVKFMLSDFRCAALHHVGFQSNQPPPQAGRSCQWAWAVGRNSSWRRATEIRQKRVLCCGCQNVHPVWQLNVRKVQNCSNTSYCSPARTSKSLSYVGGSADFVVFLWQKRSRSQIYPL